MSDSRDFFKAFREDGKSFKKWKKTHRIPKAKESIDKIFKQKHTNYPLRTLGYSDIEETITEEQRLANFHIIGEPRQGKSKLIEDQVRKDIDLGNGLCLLDPSDGGDTAKKILRYCALKGIKKVVYIDPDVLLKYDKLATLQPLKQNYVTKSVDRVAEAVNNLFGVSSQTDTPRIGRYLPALLTVLAKQGLTLHETKHFRLYAPPNELPFLGNDEDSAIIKEAFRSEHAFHNYFLSTVGRLNIFRKEPLSLMLGSDTGIDFIKMIRDGWVVLVNLYPGKSLDITQARLLGILIIAEIIHAIDTLTDNGWKGRYYLYMDEAARFATPQIDELLSYKGKTGLCLILAHHYFEQFENKKVLKAIKQGCRIKIMFNLSSYKDRLEMIEDLDYGGDIHPLLATYANQNIPKQEMIIKLEKGTPVRIMVPDVPDITEKQLPKEKLDSYIKKILNQPWYLSRNEIIKQIENRHAQYPQPKSSSHYRQSEGNPPANNKSGGKTFKGKTAFSDPNESGEK